MLASNLVAVQIYYGSTTYKYLQPVCGVSLRLYATSPVLETSVSDFKFSSFIINRSTLNMMFCDYVSDISRWPNIFLP